MGGDGIAGVWEGLFRLSLCSGWGGRALNEKPSKNAHLLMAYIYVPILCVDTES